MFYSLDVNNDGTVVKEELMVIYPDMVILEEKYTFFDQDGSEYIVIEEFAEVY
jgi:Ca2+-binding EF-hand superfamily protein